MEQAPQKRRAKKRNFHEIRKGKLILLALIKYGPLSITTLQVVLPKMTDKRSLQRTLKRLLERKIIIKRYHSIGEYVGVFFQINQKYSAYEELAKYLDVPQEIFNQKNLRYKALFYEQLIVKIMYYLEQKYPQVLILRNHELEDDIARNIIFKYDKIDVVKPDLLLVFPQTEDTRQVSIAIDYAHMNRSRKFTLQKINFFSQYTQVDGVIYFHSKSSYDFNIHELFIDRALKRLKRIKHYRENFLLTSSYDGDFEGSFNLLKNREGKYFSFQTWLDFLSTSSSKNL